MYELISDSYKCSIDKIVNRAKESGLAPGEIDAMKATLAHGYFMGVASVFLQQASIRTSDLPEEQKQHHLRRLELDALDLATSHRLEALASMRARKAANDSADFPPAA